MKCVQPNKSRQTSLHSYRREAAQVAGCSPQPVHLPLLRAAAPAPHHGSPAPPLSPVAHCSKGWAGCSLHQPKAGCVSRQLQHPRPESPQTAGGGEERKRKRKRECYVWMGGNVSPPLLLKSTKCVWWWFPHLGEAGDRAGGLHVSELTRAVTAPREDLEDTENHTAANTHTHTDLRATKEDYTLDFLFTLKYNLIVMYKIVL